MARAGRARQLLPAWHGSVSWRLSRAVLRGLPTRVPLNAPASLFDPKRKRTGRPKSDASWLRLSSTRCKRAECLNYSLLLGLLFLLNSPCVGAPCQHPVTNSLLRLARGHPAPCVFGGAGPEEGGVAACARLTLEFCSRRSVGLDCPVVLPSVV